MASKIQGKTFYVAVVPYKVDGVPDEFNELSVRAAFDDRHKRFYVSLHAGWKSEYGHGCIIMGDSNPLTSPQFVDVKDSPKNSQKTIDVMAAALELAEKGIAAYFNARDFATLYSFVKGVALNGYTPTYAKQVVDYLNGNINNKENKATMATNGKAADLIGKTITIKGTETKYVIKGVSEDGTKLLTDFYRAKDAQPMECPLPYSLYEGKVADGSYIVSDPAATQTAGTTEAAATDEVEEVDDIKVEQPKATAETVDMKPKQKKPKTEKPKAKSEGKPKDGKLRYETYTNKKGKTCAKVIGFSEKHPAYVNCADLHGSASYERTKQGDKTFYLVFGPKYAAAAKDVCEALNAGKSFADCKAIVDKATDERQAAREEAKAKRAERASTGSATAGKTYTEAEVADLLKRVIAGDKEAMEIVNAMSQAA